MPSCQLHHQRYYIEKQIQLYQCKFRTLDSTQYSVSEYLTGGGHSLKSFTQSCSGRNLERYILLLVL